MTQNRFHNVAGRLGAPRLAWMIACLLALLVAAPVLAEKRVALVIGNSAYKHAPALANPRNDAEGVATALKRLDFEVLLGVDLEKGVMERLLRGFADKIEKADVALVFYAGHGLQVSGSNYLVPIDAKLEKEADLAFEAISLDLIQKLMERSERVNILMLDACRDNPLGRNLARSMGTRSASIGRGLGQTQAGIGTLIVYATQPGNVALDGEGSNSPFTAALLANLETRGLEIRQVLTRVRQAVIHSTKGKQVPWDSSSLTGDFFFVAAAPPSPGATPAPPAPTAPDQETVFWQSIKDSKSAADYRAYLDRWPAGTFAPLAKLRIAELEKAVSVTPPAAPLAENCIKADNKTTVTIEGTLSLSRQVTLPNGRKYAGYVVRLSKPICADVTVVDDSVERTSDIQEIQLAPSAQVELAQFLNKRVVARGKAFGRQTAYHVAPIVLSLNLRTDITFANARDSEQPPSREQQPAGPAGMHPLMQACRTTWRGSDAVCQCVRKAVLPVLQPGDYSDANRVMTLVFTNKGDEAREMVQQWTQQGKREAATRIVSAIQAIGRDCKNVQ